MGIGKLKQEPKKESFGEMLHALARQYGSGLLGLLLLVMIVHDIFGTHGFLAMRRTQIEIKQVEADLAHLKQENEALEQETKDLKSDPRLIEKIARDDLGLARPGEIIIRLPQEQKLDQTQNPDANQ